LAAEARPWGRVSDRTLTLVLAVLLLVLVLTVLGGWWALRDPRMEPVPMPSASQA
jgi:hypothetical protein